MSLPLPLVRLRVHLGYYVSKIKVVGLGWTLRWLARRIGLEILWLALLPVTLGGHAAGFRRVSIYPDRIGHLASEFDCFLKERLLGRLPERKWFILAPPKRVSNPCLLDYFRGHLPVIENRWACLVLQGMARHGLMEKDVSQYILAPTGAAAYYAILAAWGARPPLLRLEPEHRRRGRQTLVQLGVPEGAWFVCVHAREPGFAVQDEGAQGHRNSSILRLIPAMREIRRRGGWVIRMGDPSMQPLPLAMEGVVDYAVSGCRSGWMDVFLCAETRLFVGNTSGLFVVSTLFGKPCALANMIPPSHLAFAPGDICIHKRIWSTREDRYLRLEEMFAGPVANYRLAPLYAQDGLRPEENTEEELVELVVEALDVLDGTFVETAQDRALQERFRALLRPEHYAYGSRPRIGRLFLRRNMGSEPS